MNGKLKILVTARYVEGTSREGGSGRFMKTVIDTLEDLGHNVIASTTPNVNDDFDCIIVSHHDQFEMIQKNEARKVYISHGVIQDERFLRGADKYVSVSEEIQADQLSRGFESVVIPQPITIRERKRPNDKLENILIIRAYVVDHDPFVCLAGKYNVRISDPNIPIEDQIDWADLCITLGRGALESMAQGKPVLIADNRFYIGAVGDGYVTRENIDEIANSNFSGRRFKHPITPEWLESELAKYNADDSVWLHQYVSEKHDARKIVQEYLKITPLHIATAFYRFNLLNTLIAHYEPMGIIWHPVVFESEMYNFEWPEKGWIQPLVIPDCDTVSDFVDIGYHKNNAFIRSKYVIPDDHYLFLDDDDMIEKQAVKRLKELNDDIVMISLKRGYTLPHTNVELKKYTTTSLVADPDNVRLGSVSKQQYIVKGHILEHCNFLEKVHFADGILAIWLKERYPIRYERDIYALFNYFEPGRWQKPDVAFGVLVNDVYRLNTVFRKSDLPGELHYVLNPESATKGINTLLGIIKNQGARIGIIAHQDMYFRNGWLDLVRQQLATLPDSWIVAGVVGKDMQGRICGNIHDMRIVDVINTSEIHDFPQPAASFDECVLIFNMEKDFKFDESLDGFDLYGTLAVLQAWEMGGTCFIINAFCEHFCMRPFTWSPDDDFKARYQMLHDRFNAKWGTVDSTVFVSKPKWTDEDYAYKPRFETSAAA